MTANAAGYSSHTDSFTVKAGEHFIEKDILLSPAGNATSTTSNTSTTTIGDDICSIEFIYGKYSKEAETLRHLRDNILSHTPEGQELIKLYYELSPAILNVIEKDNAFKAEMKELIDELLPLFAAN